VGARPALDSDTNNSAFSSRRSAWCVPRTGWSGPDCVCDEVEGGYFDVAATSLAAFSMKVATDFGCDT